MTTSLAATKEISVDASVDGIELSQQDKDKERCGRLFSVEKNAFAFLHTGFGQRFVNYCGAQQLAGGVRLTSLLAPKGRFY